MMKPLPTSSIVNATQRDVVPVSVVIPTRNRAIVLRRTLESLAQQSVQPAQIVLIDASKDRATHESCVAKPVEGLASVLDWAEAIVTGAAAQRNQGIGLCRHDVIGFFDDDILFEPDCMARIWRAYQSDPQIGGVSAMITNQRYQAPGFVSRSVFRILAGKSAASYAGRMLGPAVNLLPEDRADMPEVVAVDWLNLGCTLYRRAALPNPPFPGFFTGYSMGEDVTLSVHVGRAWKLANARTARIYHDSQPSDHKSDPAAFTRMELINRHYIMTQVLGRRRVHDYAKLALWEMFQLSVRALQRGMGREFWLVLKGKWLGLCAIFSRGPKDSAS